MTQEQIRNSLIQMESNYSVAMDAEDAKLARAIWDRIQHLRVELTRAICAEDPCTTAADVAYFEGWGC